VIAYIVGKITYLSPSDIYLETGGIGYHIHISLNTFSEIEKLSTAKIYTYYHVKEDGHSLYGFYNEEEKSYFSHLISVSGIGPNTARVILSYMNTQEVQAAILSENVAALSSVKGIGPKTAKRIILDLKDKMTKDSGSNALEIPMANNKVRDEALSALMALGFPKSAIIKHISQILKNEPGIISVEDLIKKVLKHMS
jgi:Holliday junction DNA helicase RuvA